MSTTTTIDLTTLHDQLLSLERQKTLLTAQLLSLRASHTLSSTAPPAPPPPSPSPSTAASASNTPSQEQPTAPKHLSDAEILSQVFASTTTAQSTAISRLHRIAGITTFTVRDPSPPRERLLGIRIEVFSQRKFQTPHYLLISFPTATSEKSPEYIIHRHTIPPFLQLPRYTSLPAFVRTLRCTLLLHARRVAAATELRSVALSAGRVGDVTEEWTNRVEDVEWDAGVTLVVVTWSNGAKGWVRVGEDGRVGKVVVRDGRGRRQEVERTIAGVGGVRLTGVAARMGWVRGGLESTVLVV